LANPFLHQGLKIFALCISDRLLSSSSYIVDAIVVGSPAVSAAMARESFKMGCSSPPFGQAGEAKAAQSAKPKPKQEDLFIV
jgi:hypothetical protein